MSKKNKWDNPRAERALLGGLLSTPEWLYRWADKLQPEDFSEPAREEWWRALVYTQEQGVPGDRPTMRQFWTARNTLELIALEPESPLDTAYEGAGPARIAHYAQIVFDNSMSRMESAILMQMAQRIVTRAEGEQKVAELDMRHPHFNGEATADGTPRPETYTMHALMGEQLPPVRWVVDDLFPEGVTLLAAKPKKGKTTLMMHISVAVAGGKKACGHFDTEPCEVLYLALEDNKRRMQKRMRQMMQQGEKVPEGVHIINQWQPLDGAGLCDLERFLDEHPAVHLIVVDTLEHIRPKRRSPSGSYADDYSSVRGLQQLAGRRQVAVVPIVHLRKAPAEDPFDEINATTGLMASVDNALVMRPNSGIMELHRRGRDYEDDTVLALKGDARTLLWKVEGIAADVTRSAARKAIIDVLPEASAAKGMQPIQIAEWLPNTTRGAIRKLLHEMMQEKEPPIVPDENGGYKKAPTKKPGNSSNSGNSAGEGEQKPATGADSSPQEPVTGPVTLLPIPPNSGNSLWNGQKPHVERSESDPVTRVTPVTGNINGASPVCMRCKAPKRPLPGGGYELTCDCGRRPEQDEEGQVAS